MTRQEMFLKYGLLFTGDFKRADMATLTQQTLFAGKTFDNIENVLSKYPHIISKKKRFTIDQVDKRQEELGSAGLKDYCNKFIKKEARNLFLTGGIGAGKTCAAYSTLVEISEDWNVKIEEIYYLDLLNLLSEAAGINEYAKRHLQSIIDCDVLFIDDLGRAPITTENRINGLKSIIDSREKRDKQTLITTNNNTETLIQKIGGDNFDRLCVDALVFKFKGESQRKMF